MDSTRLAQIISFLGGIEWNAVGVMVATAGLIVAVRASGRADRAKRAADIAKLESLILVWEALARLLRLRRLFGARRLGRDLEKGLVAAVRALERVDEFSLPTSGTLRAYITAVNALKAVEQALPAAIDRDVKTAADELHTILPPEFLRPNPGSGENDPASALYYATLDLEACIDVMADTVYDLSRSDGHPGRKQSPAVRRDDIVMNLIILSDHFARLGDHIDRLNELAERREGATRPQLLPADELAPCVADIPIGARRRYGIDRILLEAEKALTKSGDVPGDPVEIKVLALSWGQLSSDLDKAIRQVEPKPGRMARIIRTVWRPLAQRAARRLRPRA